MAETAALAILALFRAAMETTVRRAHGQELGDLTARQLAVLLSVYMGAGPHTVRGLAAELDVAKPVITRALSTLERSGLLRRRRDEADRRSVLVQRTVKGSVFLNDLAEAIRAAWATPGTTGAVSIPARGRPG